MLLFCYTGHNAAIFTEIVSAIFTERYFQFKSLLLHNFTIIASMPDTNTDNNDEIKGDTISTMSM